MTTTAHFTPARSPLVLPAVGTLVVSFVAIAVGTYGDGRPGADPRLWEALIPAALALTVTGLVFGIVLPRTAHGRANPAVALGLSLLAAVLVAPAFWSGTVLPLAVGGFIAGRRSRSTAGIVAVAVAVLTCAAFVAVYVGDWMSTNNIG